MKKLPLSFKIITIILVFYTLIAGLLIDVPALNILNETNSGMNINEYENFEKLLKMDNFKVNENIEFYSRENQFNKYKNLINENLKK